MPSGDIMETGYILAASFHDARGTFKGAQVALSHLDKDGGIDWQRSYDFGDWGAEQLYEVQMVGNDGFIATGYMGGGIPPGFTPVQGWVQYAIQTFLLRVPMNGILDPLAKPGVLQVRNAAIKPVVTKAQKTATNATPVAYPFYATQDKTSSVVVTPVP
jgi:hypothetical protein